MGTINEIRLININYNNGGIKISDETLHMNGINTLISLQNGGGKSVLVQMLTAPFVHKAYRRTRDRSFEGYFTGARPSFILIEWTLGGSHRMMNGFMVHRRLEETGDEGEEKDVLDIIGIVSEYKEPCNWDIHNLHVVEKNRKEMTLKSFASCKQLFEGFKKEKKAKFFMYDMGQSSQQRQYFEKLKEYKVDFREWENIIKKVNQKEGGLSELFSDCKDEKGLTEKWLLDAVEKKLDPSGEKTGNFGKIIKHHAVQCYENEDKIRRRDDILFFREKVAPEDELPDGLSIKRLAEKLRSTDSDILNQDNRIACFLAEIRGHEEKTGAAKEEKHQETEDNQRREDRLKYEKYSWEIHSLIMEKKELEGNLLLTTLELKGLKNEQDKTERSIHLLETRKVFEDEQEEYRIREKLRSDLLVARKEDAELKPRREELGGILHDFYKNRVEEEGKKLVSSEEQIKKLKDEEKERTKTIAEIDKESGRLQTESGKLMADIDSFNREEEAYQKVYGAAFTRNILGEYEDGVLIIEEERLLKEKREADTKRKTAKERKQREEIRSKKLESDLSDERINRNDLRHKEESLKNEARELERQKTERLEACIFAGLNEDSLYDREGIFRAFDLKTEIADSDIRALQEKENKVRREKEALESGRIAEIPEYVTEGFERMGINLTFGMEWLLKNGRSIESNMELVRNNPFLPYSIILTGKEFERVKNSDETFYSEMPFPMVLRQGLENGIADSARFENAVVEMGNVKFYVRFNENLLDPDKLNEMIAGCASALKETGERIRILKEEREEFIRRRELVRSETFTRELEEETQSALKSVEEDRSRSELKIADLEAEQEENANAIIDAQKEIEAFEMAASSLAEQITRLEGLIRSYERYLISIEKKDRTEKELNRLYERKKLMLEMLDKIRESIERHRRETENLRRNKAESEKKLGIYAGYRSTGKENAEYKEDIITTMETEYESITEKFSGEVRELEKKLSEQEKRFRKAEDSYNKLKRNFGIGDEDIREIIYSEEELDLRHEAETAILSKIRLKEEQYHHEDKEISVKNAHISDRMKRMEEETGYGEILPAEEIPDKNYDEEIAILKHERKNLEEEERELDSRLKIYKDIINSLDEFDDISVRESIVFEEDFSGMSGEKLNEFRGILRRDLRRFRDERQVRRNKLSDAINDLIMLPKFRDDFFRKPLEAIQRSVDSPEEVLRHIEITLRSYGDLMEKIAVDLSVIEDERKSIQSELTDYIRDLNGELNKIDSNSAIPVRDRTIKMLTLSLPPFRENEEIYRIRVRDYLETVINKSMDLCRTNQNIDEYIGVQVNTREIFDTVIGIGNVQIRLYKIEKQREYPISWAEVARNSGGEGFLSSFVILSSLLTYIRRDENDLFADRNEGKVLLMDNPFGVTYSEHLLKPLMELAEKNNTQLICFSGIGGDSIYGRFDNIYVLNLVTAGLKNGLQYLRSDHIRGSESEEVVSSQLEVLEQMTLF